MLAVCTFTVQPTDVKIKVGDIYDTDLTGDANKKNVFDFFFFQIKSIRQIKWN